VIECIHDSCQPTSPSVVSKAHVCMYVKVGIIGRCHRVQQIIKAASSNNEGRTQQRKECRKAGRKVIIGSPSPSSNDDRAPSRNKNIARPQTNERTNERRTNERTLLEAAAIDVVFATTHCTLSHFYPYTTFIQPPVTATIIQCTTRVQFMYTYRTCML